METIIKSDGPSKGVLDTIAVSSCLFVMPIEPCAFAFSCYLVVLYLTLICLMVCMTSGFFKMERRRQQVRQGDVISILACFTMPVVFGIGNLYAILNRDVDFMGASVVVLSLVIVIMAITACPIAVQKRDVFSIIWILVWICFNLYGALLLCSLYKQVRDEKPCRD